MSRIPSSASRRRQLTQQSRFRVAVVVVVNAHGVDHDVAAEGGVEHLLKACMAGIVATVADHDQHLARLPAAVALSDDDGAADTAALSRAEPVVTETMAELYLKQGHQQDALRVYQALLAQRPTDAKLKQKVEQLASGGKKSSGVSAQAFLKGIWSGKGARAAGVKTDSQREPQSTLAAAFDVAGPASARLGEPSRPAQDHISLDSVFGEEASRHGPTSQADAAPHGSAPVAAPSADGGDGSKTGGFSFDEFFAGGKAGAGEPSGAAEAPPPRTPGASRTSGGGRTQRPPEDEAEADQFQQWLKKLKS